MKIGVCLKQVPDTATKIQLKSDGTGIVEENVKFIISPYDVIAIEEALRTREKLSGSEVVAISVGPNRTKTAFVSALAMGCDRAIHLNSEGHADLDPSGIAKLLAAQVHQEKIELLFTGRQATDNDNSQVSQILAELLSWPHVTMISKFDIEADGKKAKVERDIEGGAREVWEVELPALFAANKGLNEPRYASLKGMMQAKKKPITVVAVKDASVPDTDLVAKAQCGNYQLPPDRKAGQVFKDDPDQAVTEVVRLLREEAKVI